MRASEGAYDRVLQRSRTGSPTVVGIAFFKADLRAVTRMAAVLWSVAIISSTEDQLMHRASRGLVAFTPRLAGVIPGGCASSGQGRLSDPGRRANTDLSSLSGQLDRIWVIRQRLECHPGAPDRQAAVRCVCRTRAGWTGSGSVIDACGTTCNSTAETARGLVGVKGE